MARRLKQEQVAGGLSEDYEFKNVHILESEQELADAMNGEEPVVMLVMVLWCPQCRALFPIQDELAGNRPPATMVALNWDAGIGHDLFAGYPMKFPTFTIVGGGNSGVKILGSLSTERADVGTLRDTLVEAIKPAQEGGRRPRPRRQRKRRVSRRRKPVNRRTRRRGRKN